MHRRHNRVPGIMRGALLDAGEVVEHLLVGGVPVGDQDAGEEPQDRGDRRGAPRAHGPQPGQLPVRPPDDQHVRRAAGLPGLRVQIAGQDVDRRLIGTQYRLIRQRRLYRVVEPGGPQPLIEPGAGPVHEPGRDRHAEQHRDQPGGPLGRHVPVPGQQHRGGVDPGTVRNGSLMRARRRARSRDLPAARAQQRRQQEVTHDTGFFMRLGWNDGKTQDFAFTAIDRLASGGVSVKGTKWKRKNDTAGTSFTASGISGVHAVYLAHGGLDFLIGDGTLNYAPEYVWESYYRARLFPGFFATFDLQHDNNLAFNHDRGPVWIESLRLHMQFGLRPFSAK